jgi:uncharacterized membrane protein YeaQ/YmgE (transglycosylase-associated protein family)
MSILWTIIIGFFVGLIARAIMPGRDTAGFAVTTVLGVAGALIGSLVGRVLGMYSEGEPAGLVMSVIGAIALLAAYRYLAPSTSATQV